MHAAQRSAGMCVYIASCFVLCVFPHAGVIGIIAKGSEKETGYSLQRFWQAIGFSISFVLSSFASVDANLWVLFGMLVLSVPTYVVMDTASTSNTKDFFKKLLRFVCCYSGVYSTAACDTAGEVAVEEKALKISVQDGPVCENGALICVCRGINVHVLYMCILYSYCILDCINVAINTCVCM